MSEKSHPKPNAGLEGKRFVDLFAGIGGFHLAMDSMGMQCVFASEWDRHAARVYESNFGMKPRGDITQVSVDDVPQHDVLCGGFPCQAFSISGKRLGFADTRGTLFFELARIVKERQPEALLLENVKNFAQHDDGKTLKTVLATLDEIGYVAHHKVINAAELGFPTARRRIYIVAFRKDLGVKERGQFAFPRNATPEERQPLRLFLESKARALAQVKPLEGAELIAKKADPRNLASRLARRPVSPARLGIVGGGGQGERIYSIDGPAITFSAYGGGIASKTGAYWVGGLARKLTPRECANVMGFPAKFKIAPRPQQAYKQFGNSVVVGVLRLIAGQMDAAMRRAAGEAIADPERPLFDGPRRAAKPLSTRTANRGALKKAVSVNSVAAGSDADPLDAHPLTRSVHTSDNIVVNAQTALDENEDKKSSPKAGGRGRPRTRALPDPAVPKRGRGRPKRNPDADSRAAILPSTDVPATVHDLTAVAIVSSTEAPLLGSPLAIAAVEQKERDAQEHVRGRQGSSPHPEVLRN